MKNIILIIGIIVTLFFNSCNKNNSSNPSSPINNNSTDINISQTVSANTGGTITFANNGQIVIPKGALNRDTVVSLQTLPSTTNPTGGIETASKLFELKPNGYVFNNPIQITFPYSTKDIPSGSSEAELQVYVFDGQEYVVCPSQLDPVLKTITFNTIHFSDYIIGTPTGISSGGPSLDNVNMIVKNGKVYATFRMDNLFSSPGVWWSDQIPWWQGTTYTLNQLMQGYTHDYNYYPTPGWYYEIYLNKDNFLIDGVAVNKQVIAYCNYIEAGGGGYNVQVQEYPGNTPIGSFIFGSGYGGGLSTTECATAMSGEGWSVELCDASQLSSSSRYYVEVIGNACAVYSNSNYQSSVTNSYYKNVRIGKSQPAYPINTIDTPPDTPTNPSPTNNATGVLISTSTTLSWSCSDPDGDLVTYDVYLDQNNPPSNLSTSNLSDSKLLLNGLKNGTTYYWKIVAKDKQGNSTTGPIWSFTTADSGTLPTAPILSSPTNGVTNQSTSPTLSWNVVSNAASYKLQVATDNVFANLVYNQNVGNNTSQQVSGLNNLTTYYWKVAAVNSYGTSSWSSIWNFQTASGATPCPIEVTYAGKTYYTVQIGNQCWLQENLDVGTMIKGSQEQTDNGMIEKHCYNDDPKNCTTYGGLYEWSEAVQYQNGATDTSSANPVLSGNVQGICPSGWHIPTTDEISTLLTSVYQDGNSLLTKGQGEGTNTSGFSALLGGDRNVDGSFDYLSRFTFFWSSTEYVSGGAYIMNLFNNGSYVYVNYFSKNYGFSVRCVKD